LIDVAGNGFALTNAADGVSFNLNNRGGKDCPGRAEIQMTRGLLSIVMVTAPLTTYYLVTLPLSPTTARRK